MTIAAGAVLASTVTSSATTVVEGAVALSTLPAIHALTAVARRRQRLAAVIENRPLLLMARDEVLQDNLRHARVSLEDVKATLWEANVGRYGQVLAVVRETTGDISLLHGSRPWIGTCSTA